MKLISKGILTVATAIVALGLPSCSDENPWSGSHGTGGIRLNVTASPEYVDGIPATRAQEDLFIVPEASDFLIKLEKLDGSYSKEWASLDGFNEETGFPAGAYTLTASYGSLEDEGFEKPHFVGSEQLTVLEDKETTVNVTAILANTLVSIEYTDAFKSYFSSWSAEVHSEGHDYNAVSGEETRPVFVAPGSIDIAVDFTDHQNRNAKVQAAKFEALPRHHYHVTIDVNNGNVGTAQIVISFDESVEEENVYIDLTDELYSSPAPSLIAEGFTSGQTLEMLQGTPYSSTLKLNAVARAGISSAILTISSENFTPAFGKEIDLCGASPAQQDQIMSLGIVTTGFYRNPGVFGVVDLSALPGTLPVGQHTVSLIIKDKYNRVSDPVSLTLSSEGASFEFSPEPSIFGTGEAMVNVAFNGGDPKSDLSFKAMDSMGGYVDAPIISSVKRVKSRSLPIENYQITFRLPDTDRNPVPVKVYYKGVEKSSFDVHIVVPSYKTEIDGMANKALVKVTADDPEMQTAVINFIRPLLTGPNSSAATFSRDTETGILTLSNLTPDQNYSLTLALGSERTDAGSFATEAASNIPNGDFSATSSLVYSDLQVGGNYRVSPVDYTIKSSIDRQVPDSWATLNDLTCYTGSSNRNTWFMVPSTYVENGAALIRSVGYNHAGTTPARSGGAFNTKYYCENAPASSDLKRSRGELFLGSYVFDNRVDGISFSSRPESLTFDYSYSPYGSESADVYIAVKDAAGKIISSVTESLGASTSMKSRTVSLPAYPFGSKASSLEVRFRSTSGNEVGINIPSGTALNEGVSLGNKTKDANDYKAFAAGSVLKVDNVKLNY